MIKVVLFDVDGTLVKAGGCGRRALNRALRRLYGKRDICSDHILAGSTDRDNFTKSFISAVGAKPKASDLKLIEKTYLALLPAEVNAAVRERRYEKIAGVEKLLANLSRRKNVLVGLGTGNVEHGARLKLEPSGLWPHFKFGGYGCDGLERVAVLKTGVRRAEKVLGMKVKPSQVFIVGDTEKDVVAGKQAGYHTGAVINGYGCAETVIRSAPELLAEDFSETEYWLMWLGLVASGQKVERGCFMFPNSAIDHVQHGRTGDHAPQADRLCCARPAAKNRAKGKK
ncbi:MAG: HAD hydrolase-like protein [Elusimicrobiaceae bacterium]|nr:HAD hydrolase-like protein [Elusimicrobiaceae bacterium]